MPRPGPTIDILGVPFSCLDYGAAVAEVEHLYEREIPAMLAYVNSFSLNLAATRPDYHAVLRRADLVANDGKGVMLAARLWGRRFPADLNGNALTPRILARAADRGWPAYFLGGRPGVAERAAQRLIETLPGLEIVGVRDGFFSPADEPAVIAEIRSSGAGLLLVALGNPNQELWLDRCLRLTGARLGLGVGAFFDFSAGEVPRAPAWLNRIGLEWTYRLAKEPRRLWRRYLIGHPVFIVRVLRQRITVTGRKRGV